MRMPITGRFVLKISGEELSGERGFGCDPVVMDFAKQTLLPENPDMADVDASQACTNDFVEQLAELGFQKAVGIDGY